LQNFFFYFLFFFAKILRLRAAIFEKKADFVRMFRPVGASRLATSGAVGGDGHSN